MFQFQSIQLQPQSGFRKFQHSKTQTLSQQNHKLKSFTLKKIMKSLKVGERKIGN